MPAYARTRLRQATDLLDRLLQFDLPADAIIDRYFKANRNMGARDRAFAAETVYGCLRHMRELQALYEPVHKPETTAERAAWLAATWLLKYAGWSARALIQAGFAAGAVQLVERIRALDLFEFPLAVRANLPDWLADSLCLRFGADETLMLAASLNQPAPVDIRVNIGKIDREHLQSQLKEEGFELMPTPYSPYGLRRELRGPLFTSRAFRAGLFELQDEGSQLIGLLAHVKPGQQVVDFCAGAGGKTLQMAAMMGNSGAVYAFDVARKRLDRLRPRLLRAGVHTVQRHVIQDENDPALARLAAKADVVLVDAPCSGTGTLRRNPDIKWRQINIAGLSTLQGRILDSAARLVKRGGRLVYATCSLLQEENSGVTSLFLAAHPEFKVLPAGEILVSQGIGIHGAQALDGALELFPHRHNTDGFYALVMQRAI
ncbi:MAG: RsmB/NOP family class I SAM-dependent RNA methyltransferase [Gammaproteobacteria bacterium]|nr:RsmB/NOP family class I SAM-dependent RNA methyltransferase [Gammaproteobacteria bacterium]MDE2345690.1 RsmB/NOP family class I SAM-dependent RNA methyltransferase [Gammaproteobacteria bacterium]